MFPRHAHSLFPLLVILFVLPATSTPQCPEIVGKLTHSKGSNDGAIVFRCADLNECPGLPDRLAGLTSAAFIAAVTGRALYIDVPLFGELFTPGYPWVYTPEALGFPKGKEPANPVSLASASTGKIIPYPKYQGDKPVGLLNLLNTEVPPTDAFASIKKFPILFYHANLGIRAGLLAALDFSAVDYNTLADLNRCTLRALIHPTPAFLRQKVNLLNADSQTVKEMMSKLENPHVLSLGIHLKPPEEKNRIFRGKSFGPPAKVLTPDILDCMGKVPVTQAGNRTRRILFISSLNPKAVREALEFTTMATLFHESWVQLPVEQRPQSQRTTSGREALLREIIDWWFLSRTTLLIYGHFGRSAFSGTAGLVGKWAQLRLNHVSCNTMEDRCPKKFCIEGPP